MTYTLAYGSTFIIRDADGAVIPADQANTDYTTYLAWVRAGNRPTAATQPPAPVPQCELWQLQAVLSPAQWTSVMAAVAAANNPALTAFASRGDSLIPGDSLTLISLGAAIGLTAAQVLATVAQATLVSIP